jgi:signal transduction histidine kinase
VKTGFHQQTSFTARLRIILFVIAAFFLLGIMGLYFSSQGFLTGLQDMSHANRILNLTGMTIQVMETSHDNLEKLEGGVDSTRIAPLREATRIAIQNINEAIKVSEKFPSVQSKLREALQSIQLFQVAVDDLFAKEFPNHQKLSEEILVAREYIVDAEEGISEAQIILKGQSDKTFKDIYANRFDPLIVAGLLSAAFFAFVIIVGFANSRKLVQSLRNLNRATDAVAAGDLTYQATILDADEFGKLTYEFNYMVNSLHEKQSKLTEAVEKVTRLQGITNSFSGVLLPDQVFNVIVSDVYQAIRADAGAISLISEDGKEIENRLIGYQASLSRMPMNYHSPLTKTLLSGEPRFIENIEEIKDEYPEIYGIAQRSKIISVAYLPLIAGNQVYGALNFGFQTHRPFNSEDKEFLMALTRQCSQAIHRAKLFKSATDAIQIRDEFLSIASHELRTPLTPLKLQLQNMSRQVKRGQIHVTEKDVVLRIVENSDKQVDRLINLIDDLLDVSRITAGKLNLHMEDFNFGEMTEEVIAHYSTQMKEAQSYLSVEIDKSIVCHADKVRMEQVLINLLTNAVKYAPHKPVHVRVYRMGDKARLEVRDEGEGISLENQKRIFDRFERVRDKNNIGGLGLGLYICRQIVEAHQGSISVESFPGKGSRFTVEIPTLS